MTTTPEMRTRLDQLGAVLLDATSADLQRGSRPADAGIPNRPGRGRRRRTALAALAAAAIAVPAAALGASALISGDEVAGGLPNAVGVLAGTHPTCTTVRANVEYDCVLATAPRTGDVPAGEWQGTVEPIVDGSKRVNGGCRSLNADGTHWSCYIGQAAVRHGIVAPSYLGESLPSPVRG